MSDVGNRPNVRVVEPRDRARVRFSRITLVALVSLAAAYGFATLAAYSEVNVHPTLTAVWPTEPLVIAHRGGAGLWPEATRLAFDQAIGLGVDVLEMDVHLASDGELVVIHDSTVDRTTNGSGAVREFASTDLELLDAGAKWESPTEPGTFPYLGREQGVPRLIDVMNDHPNAALLIEIKPNGSEAAEALCSLLRSEGRTADTIVGSFHQTTLDAFRTVCPEVATGATPREVRNFLIASRLRVAGPYRPRFDVLQVPVRQGNIEVITPSLVRAAKAKGVPVHAWTINESSEIQRLLDLGVEGIITDRPDRALQAMGRTFASEQVPSFVLP